MRFMRQLHSQRRFSKAALAAAMLLTIAALPAQAIQSDDFNSTTLNTSLWTFVDPVGDTQLQLTGTNLLMHFPGGEQHGLWTDCNCAPRLLQAASDTDFELELKLDSFVEQAYQSQGFIIQQDSDTYLRLSTHHDGGQVIVFAAWIDGGVSGNHVFLPVPGSPTHLQVERTGDNWEYRYSFDGTNWTTAGAFYRVMTVTEVGFFLGASGNTDFQVPAIVGNVDYFFETSSPITPEDGGQPTAVSPPNIEVWYGDNQNFGHLGNPQTLIQVLGRTWDTDALASMSYTLNGGASNALNTGPGRFAACPPWRLHD